VQTYFCAVGLKKSLAEPDDFLIATARKLHGIQQQGH
jgi:hypothetical protein